eukprot:2834836-Prymnesium_polylepis.1
MANVRSIVRLIQKRYEDVPWTSRNATSTGVIIAVKMSHHAVHTSHAIARADPSGKISHLSLGDIDRFIVALSTAFRATLSRFGIERSIAS